LLMTPRYCIQLLAKFKNLTPDSEGWQEMMADLMLVVNEVETARETKTFH
jgi:hypothetical protein